MSKCMCGAYDCGACYPATYKKYIAQEKGEIEGIYYKIGVYTFKEYKPYADDLEEWCQMELDRLESKFR